MHSIDDIVCYGAHGVCRIKDKTTREFGGNFAKYFVLRPIYEQSATIFVPLDNPTLVSRMQRLLTTGEVMEIIREMPNATTMWVENDNVRRETYTDIVRSGDRLSMVRLIKTLHQRKSTLKEERKKLHIADEKVMKEAERMLYEEFAFVLGMEQEEVVPFICKQIDADMEAFA